MDILEKRRKEARAPREAITFTGVGRTVQSQKEDADIVTILKRFKITGMLPQRVQRFTNADFREGAPTFADAMDTIRAAQTAFMRMPANVRKRFHNDPSEFVEFCSDDNNLDEMRRLGLAVPEKQPTLEPFEKLPKGEGRGSNVNADKGSGDEDRQTGEGSRAEPKGAGSSKKS